MLASISGGGRLNQGDVPCSLRMAAYIRKAGSASLNSLVIACGKLYQHFTKVLVLEVII
jgi:hypothetical protein